jgi:putative endonuclease
MSKQSYVYIMTNEWNKVLYTGITNNLLRRVFEHREKLHKGFTERYNVTKLVYFETFEDIEWAIQREKQIKSGPRQKKLELVNAVNPEWQDLYPTISGEKGQHR